MGGHGSRSRVGQTQVSPVAAACLLAGASGDRAPGNWREEASSVLWLKTVLLGWAAFHLLLAGSHLC